MWSASAHRSCSAGHCLSTVDLNIRKQQPGRPWEHAQEVEARACVVWEQDDLEKRSESGRSCDSTGRAAESILPVRGGEVNSHAEPRPVFWTPFTCFCDPTLFPPAPTAVVTATAQLYLSLTPTIGACSPSAEEGMPNIETCCRRGQNTARRFARPEPRGVWSRRESCTTREPKVLWCHFGCAHDEKLRGSART